MTADQTVGREAVQEIDKVQETFACLVDDAAARTEKISERVARRIVRDIMGAGSDEIGTKLPSEAEMSQRYGAGRGSLREALRILEVQGLITIKSGPGGGPVVAGISTQRLGATAALHLQFAGATLGSVADARLIIEPLLARHAAQRRDPDAIALLLALTDAAECDDLHRELRLASAFHVAIARAAGNLVLALLSETVREIWTGRIRGMIYDQSRRDQVQREHIAIARAVSHGHGNQAEELMRAHMDEFVQHARRSYPGVLNEVVEWL
jgi:DNA-binding FadR family transcriptional regulator